MTVVVPNTSCGVNLQNLVLQQPSEGRDDLLVSSSTTLCTPWSLEPQLSKIILVEVYLDALFAFCNFGLCGAMEMLLR